ncbi:MAG: hypothetical protein ACOX8V_06285 [Thermoleophilia bacterium]|jgi:hypothetical protein
MQADAEILIRSIVKTVPEWYVARTGPVRHEIRSKAGSFSFYSMVPHRTGHQQIVDYAERKVDDWLAAMPSPPTRSFLASVRERLALEWLSFHEPAVAWNRLFSYLDMLSYRVHENRPVTRNLVIRPGQHGSIPIDEPGVQSVLDPLAGRPQTYFLLDHEGRYVDYDEAAYCAHEDAQGYSLYPEFLQPLKAQLGQGDYLMHLTATRDLIVLGHEGMLAARRRGGWYIYDVVGLRQDVSTSLGDRRLDANLFGVLLDLSYRRHGALLVYDPEWHVLDWIINADEAVIGGREPRGDQGHRMLAQAVKNIDMTDTGLTRRKHRLLLEIASLDGAVLFDDEGILAFGAMIRAHPNVGGYTGARTTAMHSAYLWGGRPIKVSTDGEITIPFRSQGPTDSCEAELTFL